MKHWIENFIAWLGWPEWAVHMILVLSALVLLTSIVEWVVSSKCAEGTVSTKSSKTRSSSFRVFQLHYLSVYLITMLADWLQGTNMYTLYSVSRSRRVANSVCDRNSNSGGV